MQKSSIKTFLYKWDINSRGIRKKILRIPLIKDYVWKNIFILLCLQLP